MTVCGRTRDVELRFELPNLPRERAARAIDYGEGVRSVRDLETYCSFTGTFDSAVLVTCEEYCCLLERVLEVLRGTLGPGVMYLLPVRPLRGVRIDRGLIRDDVLLVENSRDEYEFLAGIGVVAVEIRTCIRDSSVERGDNSITVRMPEERIRGDGRLEELTMAIRRLGFA